MPGYRHPGSELSPGEILAPVHAELAARSPELAALVALHEEMRAAGLLAPPGARGAEAGRLNREERVAEYSRCRDEGMTLEEAAAELDVSVHTARKYERCYRGGKG